MKRLVYILTLLISSITISASNISTTYSKGSFHTSKKVIAQADFNTCSRMIDDFIYQFQTNPAQLFTWALKNTGQTHKNDGSDDVVLIMNKVSYNPDSAKSIINADFRMSNGLTIRDKDLMSYVHDRTISNNQRIINVDFYYSGSLLKKAEGIFQLLSIDDTQTQISIDINVRFGWFFNLFITQKRYRNVMEWRIGQFVDNLKEEAEQRSNI